MRKHIVIVDGHPDPDPSRFCHTLAEEYEVAARGEGHTVEVIRVSTMDFPLLRSRSEWENNRPSQSIEHAQNLIATTGHITVIYPLWLGSMPAMLKGFFEQVFRPGFAIDFGKRTLKPGKLTGKSARVIVTMGMPSFIYRWYLMAHSLKSLERNILRFVGLKPIRHSIFGNVEGNPNARLKWIEHVKKLGRLGI